MSCPVAHSSAEGAISNVSQDKCPYNPGGSAAPKKKRIINEDANEPIPQPPVRWFTGNMLEIDPAFPISAIWRLAKIYGDIYKLDFVTREAIVISSHELIDEVMDEDRFDKSVEGGLKETRALLGDGLFTAFPDEINWWKAHRILMPVFGPFAIRKMFPQMVDMISQMILKWDRLGPENETSSADDFTRLAFDTIGFCGFNYRFNSFYHDAVHPFAKQMADVLIEAGKRSSRSSVENYIRIFSAEETKKNIEAMWKLCDDLVAERKRNPRPEINDILNTMLEAVDPETGEKLSDENIRLNMVTFLAAGHETTSGTLAFLFYHLLRNPDKYHAAQAEVDRVLGDNVLEAKHLPQLKYLEASIRETLRFQGPISQIQIRPKKDTVIGNKYRVPKSTTIQVNLHGLHHDRRVWGDDADEFRPERLLNGGFEALPANAWKPYGNGRRACIGRAFAEQEMLMATALILQRFQVEMADPSYDLRLKSTLTVKPVDFKIKVTRRPGKDLMVGIPGSVAPAAAKAAEAEKQASKMAKEQDSDKQKMLILYGSNAGTCKALAEELQTCATDLGFEPTVTTMDRATERLPTDQPVIIITPSYEGKPADNARKFVSWLEQSSGDALKNVKFALLGLGNSEWVSTFHRIPKLLDDLLPKLGGSAIIPSGFINVREDLVGPWEDWRDELLASLTGNEQSAMAEAPELAVTFEKPDVATKLAGEEISEAIVKINKELASTDVGPAKKHMEVELPAGVTYRAGDYLVVLPTNPPDVIKRVGNKFNLFMDDIMSISGTTKDFLVGNGPATVIDVIGSRVELSTPASKRQVEVIAKTAGGEDQKNLQALVASEDVFREEVISKRKSVLDLLEDFPTSKLSFGAYLDMLKPLSPRQYSISSSTFAMDPQTVGGEETCVVASITYDVLKGPARSGNGRTYLGVASNYLGACEAGSKIRCYVRPSNASFHLPQDPSVPIIMVAAGTGVAPMRAFSQERACIAKAGGRPLGPALLYFGCRDSEKDFLYKDEFKEWEGLGAMALRPAFSRSGPEGSFKYVHERMWAEKDELSALFRDGGAKIYVCGSASKLARSVSETVKKMWLEKNAGKSEKEAQEWLESIREERYVSDVYD